MIDVLGTAIFGGQDNLFNWFRKINPQSDVLGKYVAGALQAIIDLVPPDLPERMQAFQQDLQYQQQTYVDLATRLQWFVPRNLPYRVVSELVRIAQSGANESAQARHLFVGAFRENGWDRLVEFVTDLRNAPSLSRPQWKILLDCAKTMRLHGHDRINAANVVVPAIIAVIDGLLNDFARVDLKISRKSLSQKEYARIRESFQRVDPMSDVFEEPARTLAFDVLFGSAYYGEIPTHGETFNRHKIMHGETLRYGTAANALRAFFLADFVVRSIEQFRRVKAA